MNVSPQGKVFNTARPAQVGEAVTGFVVTVVGSLGVAFVVWLWRTYL